jgi:hypothetical protein
VERIYVSDDSVVFDMSVCLPSHQCNVKYEPASPFPPTSSREVKLDF